MQGQKISSKKDFGQKRYIPLSVEDFNSVIGKQSSLHNSRPETNFIYKIDFPEGVNVDCDKFNAETYNGKPSKIAARLAKIKELGGTISFDSIQSDCLTQNLRTIDGELPVILANALLVKYSKRLSSWAKIIEELNTQNPLGYRISENSPVYEVKIARFLQDAAMGMTPETPWNGFYDADGGQIVVKKNGDIVCYHIYELNRFRQYLLNATRLEQPATGEDEKNPGHVRVVPNKDKPNKPFLFGWLYKENGNYFLKINLQVRFNGISKKREQKQTLK
ncbi:MAG: HpaII family restriction endonuclease [Bacteroidales bacterium]|nr:HpaII family restriction endonuclease [Bacteroidales bacterium]MDD6669416.1 HpaII family restriction endonuclease [Bacteroidales bacterium]